MTQNKSVLNAAVIVAALGYFVDIYDLILFSIVRVPSLKSLGIEGEALLDQGVLLLNMQMVGMLLGGVFWGILGDKRGRLSVLFGSIILYSIANLANGAVNSIEAYAFWRFIAGIGLAGELGAGITLVAESLPREKRGYGTTIVASVGICGALLAGYIAKIFDWRIAYYIGGVLGLLLLVLRVSVFESHLFSQLKESTARRGDIFFLFKKRDRAVKYLSCILIGVPVWYVIGILMTFSPEFAKALNVSGEISAANAVMLCYLGLVLGDISSGLLSQYLKSRKQVVLAFLLLTLFFVLIHLLSPGVSDTRFYALCLALGYGTGFWAIFVTIGAEQFGTNLRATVTTSVPNFVRGSVVPLTFFFTRAKVQFGIIEAGLIVGLASIGIALFALTRLEESFSKDLNYIEEI
jgi:MFS transporter, putative metabolite:H+ symporter